MQNSCDSVGDGQHCASAERLLQNSLHCLVACDVDAGCGLVDQNYSLRIQQSPRDVQQLFLPRAEVVSSFTDLRLESFALEKSLPESALLQRPLNTGIVVLMGGIYVLPDSSGVQKMFLENDTHVWSEVRQTQLGDVFPIDFDTSVACFKDSEQAKQKGGFTAARPTNDSNLFSGFHCKAHFFEDIR